MRSRPTRCRQRGAALVEFALVSSLLFLILFGIIEMGLIFQDQSQVGLAARQAARSASLGSTVETAESSAVSAANLPLTVNNIVLTTSTNGVTWFALGDTGSTNTAASGSLIRATVTYSHPLVTSLIFSGTTRTLTANMVMQRE
jgi:Flp pilus assembly protein TadG